MTNFSYVAVEPSGRRRSGVVEAQNQEAAMAQVVSSGLFVVEIKEGGRGSAGATQTRAGSNKKPSRADVALFTRRLADLSAAGLPLDRVLQVVSEQSESASLAEMSQAALEDVRAGSSVSAALAKFPKTFNEVYTQTLRSGEASGQFPDVASRLADFLETEVTRRGTISTAMVYPAILTTTAIGVIIFVITFVVPQLSGVFKDLGDNLLITTRMLIALSAFLTQKWYYCIGIIAAVVVAYRVWAATETGAYQRDSMAMRLPLLGPVLTKAVISRFSHVLSTLLHGGVPVLEALEIAGMSAGNRVFRVRAFQVAADVRDGRSIGASMKDTGAFPPVLTHMVSIGEETGDLPKMLSRVARSLDFEVDNGLRRLTSLVEPMIVLFMGVVVGFIVVSVLIPIYQAGDVVK